MTKNLDKLIGTMPDSELARQIGTTKYHVRKRRNQLGIAAYLSAPLPESESPKKNKLVLSETDKRKLGMVPDTTLAARWGCTAGTVTRLRNRLGIEPFQQSQETEWTTGMLNLLGDVPDNTLAREYEISRISVKIKRIELDIPPYGKKHMDPEPDLPRQVIPQIGVLPDKQIADKYGVSRVNIRIYRALHKIPPADYQVPTIHEWTAADDALLGTMSDGNGARQLGIPPWQVRHRRRLLKIAPFNRTASIRWTAARVEQLGKEPDQLLARKWKYPQVVVRTKRESLGIEPCPRNIREWTEDELAMLGTMLDTELAKKLGISQTAVANQRRALNIPPLKQAGPYTWAPKDIERLGKMPDSKLAIDLGLSYQYVGRIRKGLGIPPFKRER